MANEDLILAIGVESQKALTQMDKFQREVTKNLEAIQKSAKKTEGVFDGFAKVAKAASALFAAKQVADFFGAGIDAAVAQEKALANLGQQMKLTGEFSQSALDSFAAFADEMERTSVHGDDVILSQIAVAKTFGATNEEAQKLVKAAVELSAATGKDLPSAVQALGKSLSGNTKELTKIVPEMRGLSEEAARAGGALDLVQRRFDGSSAAQLDTFAGSLTQAGNAFGNFQEAIGKIIIDNPQVIAGIQAFSSIMAHLQGTVEANESALSSFVSGGVKAFATGLSVAIEVTGFFARALQGLVGVAGLAFSTIVGISTELVKSFSFALPDGLVESVKAFDKSVLESVANTTVAFEDFNTDFDNFQKKVDEGAVAVFAAEKKMAKGAKDTAEARDKSTRAQVIDIKEILKAQEDLKKFEASLVKDSVEGMAKLERARDLQLAQVQEFEDKSTISKRKAEELRYQIIENFQEKAVGVREKEIKEAVSRAKEMAEKIGAVFEEKKTINRDIVVDKITVDKDGATNITRVLNPVYEEALKSAASGLISGLGQGDLSGAQSVITSSVGTGIRLFSEQAGSSIGGFVGIITEAIKELTSDPVDFTNRWTSTLENIPTALENFNENTQRLPVILAEAIPEIVASLPSILSELLFKSGPKIAKGIVKALPGALKESTNDIARQFAEGVVYNLEKLSRFSEKLGKDIQPFSDALNKAGHAFGSGAQDFFAGIRDAGFNFGQQVSSASKLIAQSPVLAAQQFYAKVVGSGSDLANSLKGGLANVGGDLSTQFKGAIDNLVTYFEEKAPDIFNAFFREAGDVGTALYETVVGAGGAFFDSVTQAADAFFKKVTGGGQAPSVGGVKLPPLNPASLIPGKARGMTEVPRGYSNDSYLARLSSGERVVDAGTNQELKSFLARELRGSGASDGQVVALLTEILAATQSRPVQVRMDGKVVAEAVAAGNYRNARMAYR